MSQSADQSRDPQHNPEKDPSDWVTGDQPSTGPQESYLSTLAQEAGEEVPPTSPRRRPARRSTGSSARPAAEIVP